VTEDPPRVLELLMARPENPEGVFLNEDLVFHFSADVDRASVTRDSVRIATRDGRPARGTLSVEGSRVRFAPAPVLARDLSDGGYLPGTEYVVELIGFPLPDGVRSVDGQPLARTRRWSFRSVDAREPLAQVVFEDRDPDRVRPLRCWPPPAGVEARVEIDPQGPLFLKCDEQIDPSTVLDGALLLVRSERGSRPTRVSLRARVVENEPRPAVRPPPASVRSAASEAWLREPRAALIELLPERRLEVGTWRLAFLDTWIDWRVRLRPLGARLPPSVTLVPVPRDARVREVGGRPVWDPALLAVRVAVVERGREAGRGELVEAFVDARLRSTVAVPGADGTASWSGNGRIEVRWPAAAGSGADGVVTLAGEEPRRDVHALALELPSGADVRLSSAPGLVVLRAQGALRIAGRLTRSTGRPPRPMTFARGRLSDWLAAAQAGPEAPDWTVLVAGGDLVVDGEIALDTPLLVCAGGRIRVGGLVRAGRPDQLFRLGEGGGEGLAAANVELLEIDPPIGNPLVRPLRFAVFSGPIPPRGEVGEWLTAEALGSSAARPGAASGGSWSVRYVPSIGAADLAALAPVDHPRLLTRPGPMHLLIELVVEPGPAWRPPFVDLVRLSWLEAGQGGER
jgi:hypothetical protein